MSGTRRSWLRRANGDGALLFLPSVDRWPFTRTHGHYSESLVVINQMSEAGRRLCSNSFSVWWVSMEVSDRLVKETDRDDEGRMFGLYIRISDIRFGPLWLMSHFFGLSKGGWIFFCLCFNWRLCRFDVADISDYWFIQPRPMMPFIDPLYSVHIVHVPDRLPNVASFTR